MQKVYDLKASHEVAYGFYVSRDLTVPINQIAYIAREEKTLINGDYNYCVYLVNGDVTKVDQTTFLNIKKALKQYYENE